MFSMSTIWYDEGLVLHGATTEHQLLATEYTISIFVQIWISFLEQ